MNTVKRTERGWAGHFICADRCRFRRNTLLELGNTTVIVSTVGLMEKRNPRSHEVIGFDTVGHDRYFETMAFHASYDGRYWDANIERQVHFDSPWAIGEVDADDQANDMHEAVVDEINRKMLSGAIKAPA